LSCILSLSLSLVDTLLLTRKGVRNLSPELCSVRRGEMRPLDLLFCQLSYWVEVWRAVCGKRVAVVIRRIDGDQSQLFQPAVADLRRFGVEVVELEPAQEEAVWEAYGDVRMDSPAELLTLADYFLVAREWLHEDEPLGRRLCVSSVVRLERRVCARVVDSLHREERSFYWAVRFLASAVTAGRTSWRGEGEPISFDTPRVARGPVETMGDFIVRFERTSAGERAMSTVKFVMNLGDSPEERQEAARQWKEFNVSSLDLAGVEALADAVSSAYSWALGGAGKETYEMLRDEARGALQGIRQLASELGLVECAQVLNPERPLTYTDAMVETGYLEVDEGGKVHLSDLGEAVARDVLDPTNPENN
jgi:hypothetical protein